MKVVNKINWKVVVEPSQSFSLGKTNEAHSKELQRDCETIVKEIKRHIDNIQSVTVEYDTEELCSFCNERWEIDEDGCPTCCNAAINEWGNSYE